MNIALLNLEPQINNTALMKISTYHKSKDDNVEMYIDFFRNQYDKIYCSSLFDFTDKSEVPENAICGGTGFDIAKKLPKEIDDCDLDYSIYPSCKSSYVWFSRGCIRNCPFCIVRQKEGYIYPVEPKHNNKNAEVIEIMDNNFFANPEWQKAEKYLDAWQLPIDFSSGIDVRIFEPSHAKFINKYKIKRVHTAWDNPKEKLLPNFKNLIKYISPSNISCYILIGFWSDHEQNMQRVWDIHKLGITPFVMPYDKSDSYQNRFTRYVNKYIYKKVKWEDYGNQEDKNIDKLNPEISFGIVN